MVEHPMVTVTDTGLRTINTEVNIWCPCPKPGRTRLAPYGANFVRSSLDGHGLRQIVSGLDGKQCVACHLVIMTVRRSTQYLNFEVEALLRLLHLQEIPLEKGTSSAGRFSYHSIPDLSLRLQKE